jgi:hypothetical protein
MFRLLLLLLWSLIHFLWNIVQCRLSRICIYTHTYESMHTYPTPMSTSERLCLVKLIWRVLRLKKPRYQHEHRLLVKKIFRLFYETLNCQTWSLIYGRLEMCVPSKPSNYKLVLIVVIFNHYERLWVITCFSSNIILSQP